ncbi:hypothetical protein ACOSQ2_004219 [Xanthoceras sorbifolium]
MKSDKLLLCWLYSTVHPSIIGEITDCVTSYEVWNVLENLFAQQSMAKVLQLKQELQNITKGSMQISDFVLKVKSLGDGLKAAGEMIKDQDLVLHILNGIGHDYDPVAVLISSQKQSMSLQEVHYLLMIHEQRLAHLNSSSYVNVPAPSANYVAGNQGHRQEMEDLQMAEEVVAIEEGAEENTTTMVNQFVKSVEKEVTQQCFATTGLTELMLRIIRIILLIIHIPSSSNRLLSGRKSTTFSRIQCLSVSGTCKSTHYLHCDS